jgi:hypothetical protein
MGSDSAKKHLRNLQEYHALRLDCFGNRPAEERKLTRERMRELEGKLNEYRHEVGISRGGMQLSPAEGILDEGSSGRDQGDDGDGVFP